MTTAAEIISKAMHAFSILDQTENPTPTDLANNVAVLTDLLCSENADAACQYTTNLANATLPAGTLGQVYTFSIGTAQPSYLIQLDIVGLRSLWINDVGLTVNRDTRPAPKTDVVKTTYPGVITKWHQERRSDGSVLVTAWQPPRSAVNILIDYGGRLPSFANPAGTDTVALPPEGINDAVLLLGRRIYKSYGVVPQPTDTIFADAERANKRWRDWARGQQWLRLLRN